MIRIAPTGEDRAALQSAWAHAADAAVGDPCFTGQAVKKPWGSEREVTRSAAWSVWELSLNAGGRTSLHCHRDKDVLFVVLSGQVRLRTLKREFLFGYAQQELVLIERGAFHSLEALCAARVIEIESSANRDDLVRIADLYGRVQQGYAVAAG